MDLEKVPLAFSFACSTGAPFRYKYLFQFLCSHLFPKPQNQKSGVLGTGNHRRSSDGAPWSARLTNGRRTWPVQAPAIADLRTKWKKEIVLPIGSYGGGLMQPLPARRTDWPELLLFQKELPGAAGKVRSATRSA